MLGDKLSGPMQRILHSRVVHPVIVKAKPGALHELWAEARQYELSRFVHSTILSPPLPFTYSGPIASFDMFAGIFARRDIEYLGNHPLVEKVYPDRPLYALQEFPTVPQEGVYQTMHITFTSTWWTRRLIGADWLEGLGFTGKGVKVAVPDTGVALYHEQVGLRPTSVEFKSVLPAQETDGNGHGCVTPDTLIVTSNPGVQTIQGLYESLAEDIVETNAGLTKILSKEVRVPAIDPETGRVVWDRLVAVHRLKYRGKLYRIRTVNGFELELTPWHPVLVAKKDYRHGWSRAQLFYKRADEVRPGDYVVAFARPLDYGEYQVIEYTYREAHTRREVRRRILLDEKLAWLIGYTLGDGTIGDYYVRLSDEKIEVLEYAKRVAESHGFKTSRIYGRGRSYVIEIYTGYSALLRSMNVIVGDNGRTGPAKRYLRRVPEAIFKSPPSVRAAFVAGIIDSEGFFVDSEHSKATRQSYLSADVCVNTSQELCRGVSILLKTLGIHPVFKKDSWPLKRGWSEIYYVSVAQAWRLRRLSEIVGPYIRSFKRKVIEKMAKESVDWGVHDGGDWVAFKVTGVDIVDYDGYLYDMTTERHNNYWANGFVAHNTWCCTCIGGSEAVAERASHAAGREVRVKGVAPEVDLFCIKVLGYVIGTGSNSGIIKGLELAHEWGADVISMSLGGKEDAEKPEDDPFYPVFENLVEAGTIPVVAAGNEGPKEGTISTPGALPNAFTIGAYDPINGVVADFSSRGPTPWGDIKPDVVAPGVNIESGSTGVLDPAEDRMVDHYSVLSGTSMATPHAAGLVALFKQVYREVLNKELTLEELMRMVETYYETRGVMKDNTRGWGIFTADILREWLSTQYGVELESHARGGVSGMGLW